MDATPLPHVLELLGRDRVSIVHWNAVCEDAWSLPAVPSPGSAQKVCHLDVASTDIRPS